MSSAPNAVDHAQSVAIGSLVCRKVEVDHVAVNYGDVGRGPTVVFAHGWAMRPRSYRHPVERLARLGVRVVVPSLPGFGGTPELADDELDFPGYAAWLARFLDTLGIRGKVVVVGHSFGGGVATCFARLHPGRTQAIVLVNPVCGFTWARADQRPGTLAGRPLWEWGMSLGADLFAPAQLTKVVPKVLGDALPNVARNPRGMWRIATMIRKVDLRKDLEELRKMHKPAQVLWSDRDRLIPRASFDGICHALGVEGIVVEGNHGWLMVHPEELCDAVARTLVDARVEGFAGSDSSGPLPRREALSGEA